MSWVSTAVSVGGGLLNTAASSQAASKRSAASARGQQAMIDYARANPSVFGEKMKFENVDYSPLFKQDAGYGNLAGDVIAGNKRNLPAAQELAGATNEWITQDAMRRMEQIYPMFGTSFNQQAQNTQNLLRGQLPTEDLQALTARRTEAQSLGGGGANAQQVAADLGLARLDLMNRGAEGLAGNVNLWNAIDPLSRRLTPQSMFVDTGAAIQSAIAENQFSSTFAASERDAAFNAAMMPDPQKAGMLNLLSSQAGAAAAAPQGQGFLGMLGSGLATGYGAYQGAQTNKALMSLAGAKTPGVGAAAPAVTTPSTPFGSMSLGASPTQAQAQNAFGYLAGPAQTQGGLAAFFTGAKRTK